MRGEQGAENLMASIVLDIKGIFILDYLEEECTINGAYYAEKLR